MLKAFYSAAESLLCIIPVAETMRHVNIAYPVIKYSIALPQNNSLLFSNIFFFSCGYKGLLPLYKTDYILTGFHFVFYLAIIRTSKITELTLLLIDIQSVHQNTFLYKFSILIYIDQLHYIWPYILWTFECYVSFV